MKRWFITVIKRYANGSYSVKYLCVNARNKQSAEKKARAEFAWQLKYSLVAVDIVNVIPADSIDIKALRAQMEQAKRAISDAEKFLQIEKRKYDDLCCQIDTLEA